MSYQKFGIRPDLVERVKFKMKNPVVKDRMKQMLANVNKYDLQDRAKVRKMVKSAAAALSENLTETQEDQIITFILSQKIDPNNTFHLLKLWATFR